MDCEGGETTIANVVRPGMDRYRYHYKGFGLKNRGAVVLGCYTQMYAVDYKHSLYVMRLRFS